MISFASCLFTGFMIAPGWFAGREFAAFGTLCKITTFNITLKYRINPVQLMVNISGVKNDNKERKLQWDDCTAHLAARPLKGRPNHCMIEELRNALLHAKNFR